MTKKLWVLGLVCAAIFCGAMWSYALDPDRPVVPAENIVDVNFGNVYLGQVVTKEVTLENNLPTALRILSVRSNCGCIKVESRTKVVPPKSAVPLVLSADGESLLGTWGVEVTAELADANSQEVKKKVFRVTYATVSDLKLETDVLDFGEIDPDSPLRSASVAISPSSSNSSWDGIEVRSSSKELNGRIERTANGAKLHVTLAGGGILDGLFKGYLDLLPVKQGVKTGEVRRIAVQAKILGDFTTNPKVLYFKPSAPDAELPFKITIASKTGGIGKMILESPSVRMGKYHISVSEDGTSGNIEGILYAPEKAGALCDRLFVRLPGKSNFTLRLSIVGYVKD